MAKPAFIYAFDNLGPERFTELCGLLLASRYKGFLLGGVGPDGGIDGEIDEILGRWNPESISPLLNEVIQPGQLVVFQFKHKTTARLGQVQTRAQLLSLYKCTPNRICELHRDLIIRENPVGYVLVTNVEVNSQFRSKFIERCKAENPDIKHYQIVGLDELEMWVTMEPQLRHLYFPTIFGLPRFNLQIQLSRSSGFFDYGIRGIDFDNEMEFLEVSVLNVGTAPSYVNSVSFKAIVDGELGYIHFLNLGNELMKQINPEPGTVLEPGRKQAYRFPFDLLREMRKKGREVFPVEILVSDEIGNVYSAAIPEEMRDKILE